MSAEKRVPIRQCMGCREHKPRTEMIRVVRSPEGVVSLDENGKKPGRGVYLCKEPECRKRVKKNRALERSLQTAIPPEVMQALDEASGSEPEARE